MSDTFKYSFTVTLKPNLFKLIAEEQYDKTYLPLYKHLAAMSHKFTLIAELTKNANVHYHGMIQFPMNKKVIFRKKFIDSFRKSKEFGFVNITQITDEEGWRKYIIKDINETREAIGRPPIIEDFFYVFGPETLDNFHQYNLSDDC